MVHRAIVTFIYYFATGLGLLATSPLLHQFFWITLSERGGDTGAVDKRACLESWRSRAYPTLWYHTVRVLKICLRYNIDIIL